MLKATLYLVGKESETGNLVENTEPCSMCKRLIINAGLATVIIRKSNEDFETISVSNWIENDDTLPQL